MTNYRENTKASAQSFIDITSSQIAFVSPNKTVNKVENSSFESPTYNSRNGYLEQYNWTFNWNGSPLPHPVTFHHAYSGSFAWKVRMTDKNQKIAYGLTNAIQPAKNYEYHDVLSFYCYCVEDATAANYLRSEYGRTIISHEHVFQLEVYGINNNSASFGEGVLLGVYDFSLNSLPKNSPGDIDIGVSGSKNPHFYPWHRVVYKVPNSTKKYTHFYFIIHKKDSNPLINASSYEYDTYFVIDAVQLEEQPNTKYATMYFDGSYEAFNQRKYPLDFQWSGEPYKSTSLRSGETRINGELIDANDYCNFYVKDISGLSTPNVETQLYTKTLSDGQFFVDQIIKSQSITISGRIIGSNQAVFMDSFTKFNELIGKKPFAEPEPVRLFLNLKFTNGVKLLPVYLDVVYKSGLEQDTANLFQSDVTIEFDVISTHIQYANDSATNMFNDSPLFDQFNTMNVEIFRDVGGLIYYNKSQEKWEIPGNIGFFNLQENTHQGLPFGGGVQQYYESKSSLSVGNVFVIKEDKNGVIWFGGDFDVVEFDAYYVDENNESVSVRLQTRVNNIVGIRRATMSGTAYVLPEINNTTVSSIENGPNLTQVIYVSDWQIIVLLDAPQRFSNTTERDFSVFVNEIESKSPLIGIPNGAVRAIEFTPKGDMYIGGNFDFTYGGRRFFNIARFSPYGSDSQNVDLYIPHTAYNWIAANFNNTNLQSRLGRGRFRVNWINCAIPYCKYGVYFDVGRMGDGVSVDQQAVLTMTYDAINECIYVGGTFVKAASIYYPYIDINVYRIAKLNINNYVITGLRQDNLDSGVDVDISTANYQSAVYKILVDYTPSGVRVFACGKFVKYGKSTALQQSYGIAIIQNNTAMPTQFVYLDTNGGGFSDEAGTVPAVFYDAVQTSDGRIFVGGDFRSLNVNIKPYIKIRGIAEYRFNGFVDITRGMEANNYPDSYDVLPAARSLTVDSQDNIYFTGNFTNIRNRNIFDGMAKWDGEDFVGMGLYFLPKLPKTIQKIYVDSADNIFVFTGPNSQKTTILRTLYTDVFEYSIPTNLETIWTGQSYKTLNSVFDLNYFPIEFYYSTVVSGATVTNGGIVNAVCVVGDRDPSMKGYATEQTVFIAGRFDYIKIADTEFKVNNIVALRYDANQNPFPYKVLAISNGITPYYDAGSQGEDAAFVGVNLANGTSVTNSQIYSIDVRTQRFGAYVVPTHVYVGGRFDFIARGYVGSSDSITKTRFKNFFEIQLQRNQNNSDLIFNVPENFEQSISVPYINYANFRACGRAGVLSVNDAVYVVKTAQLGTSVTDINVVFFAGDFTEVANGNTVVNARRIAAYSVSNTYLPQRNQYYTIGFEQGAAIDGADTGSAYNANIYIKALEYTPWHTSGSGGGNHDTTLIVGGRFDSLEAQGVSASATTSRMVRVGIGTNIAILPTPRTCPTSGTFNAQYINDSAFDGGTNVYVVGDINSMTSPTQQNIARLTGSLASNTVTVNRVASTNWGSIYQSSTGLPYPPTFVTRQELSGALVFTGGNGNTLFKDKVAVKLNGRNWISAANYAYAAPNVSQVQVELYDTSWGTSFLVEPLPRRYVQTQNSMTVGRAIPIQQTSFVSDYTISIPYQDYNNTLFDAVPMQTFNCFNTGTATVYPTITLYTPFKPNTQIAPFLHVITNVTTKQSLYLNVLMQANELIRIRTEKERISVISNIRGDITNVILNAKGVLQSNITDTQVFRLVPGKNIIRYGPMMPMQRYFETNFQLSNLVYNLNRNAVVAPIVVSFSWPISFNSIYDAIPTEVNPLLL